MPQDRSSSPANDDSFAGPLAAVLFDTPAPLGRAGLERRAVERFFRWFDGHAATSDVRLAAQLKRINGKLLPKLSGASVLQILRHIERGRPHLLPAMAIASAWRDRLRQAAVYESLLRPASLERLAKALERERAGYD